MSDVLLQTRVPAAIAKWVARRADSEGDTVAGWLRRFLTREATMARVNAWVDTLSRSDPRVVLFNRPPAAYVLELLRVLSPTASVYAIGHGEATSRPGALIKGANALIDTVWFREPSTYRVILDGGPRPHRIMNVLYNSTQERWEITLEVDFAYPNAA